MHHLKICILYAYVKELRGGDERDMIPDKTRQRSCRRQHANLPCLNAYSVGGRAGLFGELERQAKSYAQTHVASREKKASETSEKKFESICQEFQQI